MTKEINVSETVKTIERVAAGIDESYRRDHYNPYKADYTLGQFNLGLEVRMRRDNPIPPSLMRVLYPPSRMMYDMVFDHNNDGQSAIDLNIGILDETSFRGNGSLRPLAGVSLSHDTDEFVALWDLRMIPAIAARITSGLHTIGAVST